MGSGTCGPASSLYHQGHQEQQEHQEGSDDWGRIDGLAAIVVDAGLAVHRALGPGLLESVYEACLDHELRSRGLSCRRQVILPVIYDGVRLNGAFRLDLAVENVILVEIKAVETLSQLHVSQVLTYLKLSRFRLGFLMNFNVIKFKNGIRRLAY